jgi:hypothetical protein
MSSTIQTPKCCFKWDEMLKAFNQVKKLRETTGWFKFTKLIAIILRSFLRHRWHICKKSHLKCYHHLCDKTTQNIIYRKKFVRWFGEYQPWKCFNRFWCISRYDQLKKKYYPLRLCVSKTYFCSQHFIQHFSVALN